MMMPCLPLDQFDRCCSCRSTRYNDLGEHYETMDGEYLCSHCYRLAWGKRQPKDCELRAFMDDPDRYLNAEAEARQLKETILKMIEADARC
jgi:recombinational DNA repair protein (RecF pathway)